MFTKEEIRDIYKEALEKKWPYHYLFNSLKSIGIERYEVDVLNHEIKYVGQGGSIVEPPPADWVPLQAGEKFNLDGVKTAIKRSQAKEITYPQFLAEIAAAGIGFYRVDMKPRTVTYHGPGRDKHIEPVPL